MKNMTYLNISYLDHTHQPKKIFDYALNNSKYVILYCIQTDI